MDLGLPEFERVYGQYLGRFELVTCSEVVEHMAADGLAVERLARLLAPRGTLVLTVPGGKMSRFDQLIGHQRHYSEKQLQALCEGAQLEPLAVLAWGFPFQNLYRSAVRIASRISMPEPGRRGAASASRGVGALLGAGYTYLGRALKPLFYLNRNYWGEQMLLVAQKP